MSTSYDSSDDTSLYECAECDATFTTEKGRNQHFQAKHHCRRRKSLQPEQLNPPVESGGEWVMRDEFRGRKSFGAFECSNIRCGKSWVSAHAFPIYLQGCQACNVESLPKFMWVNAERDERSEGDETGKLDGPHDSDRCEACRKGVCSASRSVERSYSRPVEHSNYNSYDYEDYYL